MRWRFLLAMAAALVVAQCASRSESRFQPEQSRNAMVILGVAEQEGATHATYTVLWRLVDPQTGRFTGYQGRRIIELETNASRSVRVPGLPGEFWAVEIPPGRWALDSVYATVSDGRVLYVAQGLVQGPERPAFDVRAGEAVYIGIWEATLERYVARVRPWRLDSADMQHVTQAANAVAGEVQMRETHVASVACAAHRLNGVSRRQIC